MQLHEIIAKTKKKTKKRIGRGGKRGSFSGKGMNGQKSRSGNNREPIIRGMIKRYPKLRGYRFKSHKTNDEVISIATLEKNFESGETVSPASLFSHKVIRKIKGHLPVVKILGQGKLTKELIIENCFLSRQSQDKIKKAGGRVVQKKPK